ncbi:MAG: F0F1 ATP synthase subunit gamma [Actinomycetota bacterium]|nr:F0F1 ATP synthase subunit gamma [Actinomycetota bacterium]
MAGGQERILKRRIKSINATKKITRAMELIAGSRIVKAQARVQAAVPYANGITDVVRNLQAGGAGSQHPMLVEREQVSRVAQIVIAADRGLCGAYNSAVIRAGEAQIKGHAKQGRDYALVTVGRKPEGYFRFRNYAIDSSFSGFSDKPTYEDARQVANSVLARYEAGELDLVQLVYTRFVSVGRQEVVVRNLLPLADEDLTAPADLGGAAYEFEPSADGILDELLPRYAEARVYAALLNAAASEHAARQRAMKAATDNAEELIHTLTRIMNRARQDAITTEIMEIVGGAEALRQVAKDVHIVDVHDAEYFERTARPATAV